MSAEMTWKGKLLTEYTKDELVGIIQKIVDFYERSLSNKKHEMETLLEISHRS